MIYIEALLIIIRTWIADCKMTFMISIFLHGFNIPSLRSKINSYYLVEKNPQNFDFISYLSRHQKLSKGKTFVVKSFERMPFPLRGEKGY